jgi:fermentation-respiration switch protein FrsA (DUF1100 family)
MILGVAVATYLAALALLFLFQRNLIFVPNQTRPSPVEASLDGLMEEVRYKTADGLELMAWFRPPMDNRPMLVFFHGNAGNIGHRAYRLPPFLEAGYGILLVEYRGYGGNPGKPSEAGFDEDGRAALDFLAARGIDGGRLILYGESLGSGVAVRMASERPCGALILESPYTSVADVAQDRYWMFPVRALVLDRFDSLSRIGQARCPVLIMHGEHDRIVPIKFGRALFDAAREPKEFKHYPDGGHTDLIEQGGNGAALDFVRRMVR